jgi:hypothetical protein
MRQLKIKPADKITSAPALDKSLKYLSEPPEFVSFKERRERYAYAESRFEARTGLKEGAKVRYIGVSDEQLEYWSGMYSNPRGILDFETIYEIEYIVIGRSYTIVKLVGFKEEEFNGVIFEAVNKEEEKKCLKAGGYVRYIGTSEQNLLDSKTIYEVECVERHPSFIGHTIVKLVGFEGKTFDRILFEKVVN